MEIITSLKIYKYRKHSKYYFDADKNLDNITVQSSYLKLVVQYMKHSHIILGLLMLVKIGTMRNMILRSPHKLLKLSYKVTIQKMG